MKVKNQDVIMTNKELSVYANALQKKAVQIWESNEVTLDYEFDTLASSYLVGFCFPKNMHISAWAIGKFLDYCKKNWGKDCPMMGAILRTKTDYHRENLEDDIEFGGQFLCWQDRELSRFLLFEKTRVVNTEQPDLESRHFAYVSQLLNICRETIPGWSDNKLREVISRFTPPKHVGVGFEINREIPFRRVMEFYQKCSNVLGPDCPVVKYGDIYPYDEYKYLFKWIERDDLWIRTVDKIKNNIPKTAKIIEISRISANGVTTQHPTA